MNPIKVAELEISTGIGTFAFEEGYEKYRVLIRFQKKPIGWISFTKGTDSVVSTEELENQILLQLGWSIIETGMRESMNQNETASSYEAVSVVVCTRNRTPQLSRCLESLLKLNYPSYEIIVVDNAPSNDDTHELVKTLPVRYVREEYPGLDWARNRGIKEASYNIIAFTDDDIYADPFWLKVMNNGFKNKEVMAVTGYVAPAELETPSQQIFELKYGGMGHGFNRSFLRKESLTERQLLWASGFGIGANMAFRREVFEQAGMFDVSFDVGTPSHGGGDIEFFHRLLTQGHLLQYEPSMIIWHYHRRENASLRRQIADNGRSFGCYLINCFSHRTVKRKSVIMFFLIDWLLRWNLRNLFGPRPKFPRSLALAELMGMMVSPIAYIQTKARAKKQLKNYRRIREETGI
jgi:glycosyltransferase involved in cell wall biosynthesis